MVVSIRYIAVLGSQLISIVISISLLCLFPSAISRYLVPNRLPRLLLSWTWLPVSIRYIAVLGSQLFRMVAEGARYCSCFHPLYRGTWFPTLPEEFSIVLDDHVSIRYIAVLGSQPYQKNTPSDQRRRKRFTHPPSNRSHSHICFLKSR